MGLLAAVFSGAAAYYFPWPESEKTTDQTSKKLFENFDDQTNQVWAINIVEYDRETEGLKSFGLRRKGQKWVIPGKSNFVATGALIPMVKSCLSELMFVDEQSDNQQDHEKFGVLDPLDYNRATNRDSLGIKLTLEDVNRTVLASLIIGDQVRNEPFKYYARKPGQPKVYVVEFDPQILSTKFSYAFSVDDPDTQQGKVFSWLDPNLVGLRNSLNPEAPLPVEIVIQNYRMNDQERVDRYRTTIYPTNPNLEEAIAIELPKDNGWEKLSNISEEDFKAYFVQFGTAIQSINLLIPTDVRAKNDELAKIMTSNPGQLDQSSFEEAIGLGFLLKKSGDEVEILGSNGAANIQTNTGLDITLVFGGLAVTREAEPNSLNYYMMAYARLADSMKSEPEKPAPADGDTLSEAEEREYARQLETWKDQSKAAVTAVKEFNQKHGGWYYIIGENVLTRLRPEIVVNSTPTVEPSDEENQDANQTDDSK